LPSHDQSRVTLYIPIRPPEINPPAPLFLGVVGLEPSPSLVTIDLASGSPILALLSLFPPIVFFFLSFFLSVLETDARDALASPPRGSERSPPPHAIPWRAVLTVFFGILSLSPQHPPSNTTALKNAFCYRSRCLPITPSSQAPTVPLFPRWVLLFLLFNLPQSSPNLNFCSELDISPSERSFEVVTFPSS